MSNQKKFKMPPGSSDWLVEVRRQHDIAIQANRDLVNRAENLIKLYLIIIGLLTSVSFNGNFNISKMPNTLFFNYILLTIMLFSIYVYLLKSQKINTTKVPEELEKLFSENASIDKSLALLIDRVDRRIAELSSFLRRYGFYYDIALILTFLHLIIYAEFILFI